MRRLSPAVALAFCLALAPAGASASDGENALSGAFSYGRFSVPKPADSDEGGSFHGNGGVLSMEFERGFSDALYWRVSGGGGLYRGPGGLSWSTHATFGFTYVVDILKYVPYANIGIGGIVIGGGDVDPDIHALLEIGGGLDILHSRKLSYGVQARFESFIQQTAFFTVGVRVTYRWGFF